MSKLIERMQFVFANDLYRLIGITVALTIAGNAVRHAMGLDGSILLLVLQVALTVMLADRLASDRKQWRQRWCAIFALAGRIWRPLTKLAILVTIMAIAAEQNTQPITPLVQQVYALVSNLAPIIVALLLMVHALSGTIISGSTRLLGNLFMNAAWAGAAYMTVLALIGHAGDGFYEWVMSHPNQAAVLLTGGILISFIIKTMGNSLSAESEAVAYASGTSAAAMIGALKEPSERDLRYIAAHEAGHALAYAALGSIPNDMKVVGRPTKGQIGVLGHVTGITSGHRLEKTELMKWKMLVLLCGKQGEIAMFGDSTLGSTNDHHQWMNCAREYLSNHNFKLFYGSPQNQFELDYDARQIESLLSHQQAIVKDLFTMNPAVFKALYQAVLTKGTLDQNDLVPILSQVNLPDTFARPNGPVHEITCEPVSE